MARAGHRSSSSVGRRRSHRTAWAAVVKSPTQIIVHSRSEPSLGISKGRSHLWDIRYLEPSPRSRYMLSSAVGYSSKFELGCDIECLVDCCRLSTHPFFTLLEHAPSAAFWLLPSLLGACCRSRAPSPLPQKPPRRSSSHTPTMPTGEGVTAPPSPESAPRRRGRRSPRGATRRAPSGAGLRKFLRSSFGLKVAMRIERTDQTSVACSMSPLSRRHFVPLLAWC